VPTPDDRSKGGPTPATNPPPKDDRPKGVSVGNPPAKDDRPKGAVNPLVGLHEAIVAAGPGDVWTKVADSLNPLLQDWQSLTQNQRWDRLARNLAAATTIAAGMSLLWERGRKYYESGAEAEPR
jgi:hypothetical protein